MSLTINIMELQIRVPSQIGRDTVAAILNTANVPCKLHFEPDMLWISSDTPVVPLLKALNRAGLRLRSESWNELHVVEGYTSHSKSQPVLDEIREWQRDDEATFNVLLLVGEPDVPREAISTWTDEQCQQAELWAGAVHLHASDNDDVVVPPMPAHVAAFLIPHAIEA